MAYTPTEWHSGDTVTAEKLNKIENGIAEGGSGSNEFIVKFTTNDFANVICDKSYSEITEATENGMKIVPILIFENNTIMNATEVCVDENGIIYYINFLKFDDEMLIRVVCKYANRNWNIQYSVFTLTQTA